MLRVFPGGKLCHSCQIPIIPVGSRVRSILLDRIRWDTRLAVRRIVAWATNLARGREDRRQTHTMAKFVEGGTIRPAPVER